VGRLPPLRMRLPILPNRSAMLALAPSKKGAPLLGVDAGFV
jgi:hypothetical protein